MIWKNLRWTAATLLAANLATFTPVSTFANNDGGSSKGGVTTSTPVWHVVVIFQENVSFDHYFATYPQATNPSEEVQFHAKASTPSMNGLTQGLLDHNLNQSKGGTFYQPVRLDPSQNYTCDQNHDYTPEQQAFDSGLMDKFPEFTATPCPAATFSDVSALGAGIVMGYYDGNTVQGLWNYAQNFAMNDNSFGTNYGPSTPGAINVVSGMTGGADPKAGVGAAAAGGMGTTTFNGVTASAIIGDADPFYDDCSGAEKAGLTEKNVGDLLSAKGVSWGWFQGGIAPNTPAVGASANRPAEAPRGTAKPN